MTLVSIIALFSLAKHMMTDVSDDRFGGGSDSVVIIDGIPDTYRHGKTGYEQKRFHAAIHDYGF